MRKETKENLQIFGLIGILIVILIACYAAICHPVEIDLSLIEHDEIKQFDIVTHETIKFKPTLHKLSYAYNKTSDVASRTEIWLDSLYPLQEINIIGKYEYFRENIRRNRIGAGIGKKFGIFSINQFLTREWIHKKDNNNLFDTNLIINYQISQLGLFYQYSFVTDFGDIDYKYIKIRISNKLTDYISLSWELDRRWEEKQRDFIRLFVSIKN